MLSKRKTESQTDMEALQHIGNAEANSKAATELTYLVREIQLLQSLDHPSLNKLYEYYLSACLLHFFVHALSFTVIVDTCMPAEWQ